MLAKPEEKQLPISPELRFEMQKLDKYIKQQEFLTAYKLETVEELSSFIGTLQSKMDELLEQRKQLDNKIRRVATPEIEAEYKAERRKLSGELAVVREDIATAKDIEKESSRLVRILENEYALELKQRNGEIKMNKVNNIQGLSYVNPEGIVPFENNPFEVRDDEEMKSLIESIREYGILTPLVVSRQGRRGDVIQLVSGHRRLHAAKELGLQVVPVSYVTMTPNEIAIAVVDSNLQREKILPSEKAKAYKLKLDALKHQGITSAQVGQKWSVEQVAEDSNESRSQIQRYIRLNNLIPEILQMVDEEKIALTPAVELSYLSEDEQKWLLETIETEEATPSLSQAQEMKNLSQAGMLDMDQIFSIMVKPKANQKEVIKIKVEVVDKYLKGCTTPKEREDFLLKACEYYSRFLQRQRNKDRGAR